MFASLVSGFKLQAHSLKKTKKNNSCVNGANICENKVVKVKIVVAVMVNVGG